jgi:tRNA(Ile)-lysidine synthase TilS/MesJ
MKAMLEDIERRMPGRKDTMIRALANVRPSHLLDRSSVRFCRAGRAYGLTCCLRLASAAARPVRF